MGKKYSNTRQMSKIKNFVGYILAISSGLLFFGIILKTVVLTEDWTFWVYVTLFLSFVLVCKGIGLVQEAENTRMRMDTAERPGK